MYRIWFVIGLIEVAFIIFCFIDVLLTQEWRIKALPRIVWLIIVLILSPLGGIAWLVAGKERVEAEQSPWSRRMATRPAAPTRPDDDPVFLKSINGESIDDRIARLERELAELDDDDPRQK